jgi:hypothetical protein
VSNVIALNQVQPQVQQVNSFTQDQRHMSKSEIFVPIKPAQIAEVLNANGFGLVSLKAGKARKPENMTHQTTIARYRSENPLQINGLYMDIVFKVPHLYGSLQAFLGTYRQVCSNGLVVGSKFFEAPRIRHSGDALTQVEALIPRLVSMHDQLVDSIREMQARDVTGTQIAEFVRQAAHLRLGQGDDQTKIINVSYQDLIQVRRSEDRSPDAFSVMNVVQENLMRYGLRYQTQSQDEKGRTNVRNMTARPILRSRQGEVESIRSVDLNASIWDAAREILMTK